jgi:hypothetical protein
MQALGNYILRGRLQAVAVISLLALISLILPPFAYLLSGVPVGLVTLRRGALIGIQIIIGSLLAMELFALMAQIPPQVSLALAIVIWVPVWLCAIALRSTESQGVMVLVAGMIGIAFIVTMYLGTDDVAAWWQHWLVTWIDTALPVETGLQYKQVLEPVFPLLNAIMAAGLVMSIVLTMFIARWWQASLLNPGGFRKEFMSLHMHRILLLPVALGFLFMMLSNEPMHSLLRDSLIVMVFLYLFHGIAVVHRIVSRRNLPGIWLFCMYFMLLVVPQSVLFLACLGIADSLMTKYYNTGRSNNA